MIAGYLLLVPMMLASSSVNTTVRTEVGGNGRVETKIKTTVNGKTEVVESNEPGVIEVRGSDEGFTVIKEEQEEGIVVEPEEETIEEDMEVDSWDETSVLGSEDFIVVGEEEEKAGIAGWVENLFEKIRDWCERVFPVVR